MPLPLQPHDLRASADALRTHADDSLLATLRLALASPSSSTFAHAARALRASSSRHAGPAPQLEELINEHACAETRIRNLWAPRERAARDWAHRMLSRTPAAQLLRSVHLPSTPRGGDITSPIPTQLVPGEPVPPAGLGWHRVALGSITIARVFGDGGRDDKEKEDGGEKYLVHNDDPPPTWLRDAWRTPSTSNHAAYALSTACALWRAVLDAAGLQPGDEAVATYAAGCAHLAATCDSLCIRQHLAGGARSLLRTAASLLRADGDAAMARLRDFASKTLRSTVHSTADFNSVLHKPDEDACSKMVEDLLLELQRYKDVLSGVLPPSYVPAGVAAMHDMVAGLLTRQIIGAVGFTEEECTFLPRSLTPLVEAYPPVASLGLEHRRLCAALRMLDGTPLAEIPSIWASGEWRAMFDVAEVLAVVRAVFADSPRRSAVLAALSGEVEATR
ncbi:hypothetical protein NFJ02_21g44680 [Pycnococcus provasolii]